MSGEVNTTLTEVDLLLLGAPHLFQVVLDMSSAPGTPTHLPGRAGRGSGSAGKKAEPSSLCVDIKIYLKLKFKLKLF